MGMRAITGAESGTGHNSLYFDIGLEQLSERRKRQKLTLYFKMKNQLLPRILCEIIPETTPEKPEYIRKPSQNTSLRKTSTKALQTSFIPSTVNEWNSILVATRGIGTLEQFKQEITPPHIK